MHLNTNMLYLLNEESVSRESSARNQSIKSTRSVKGGQI